MMCRRGWRPSEMRRRRGLATPHLPRTASEQAMREWQHNRRMHPTATAGWNVCTAWSECLWQRQPNRQHVNVYGGVHALAGGHVAPSPGLVVPHRTSQRVPTMTPPTPRSPRTVALTGRVLDLGLNPTMYAPKAHDYMYSVVMRRKRYCMVWLVN